MSDVEEIYSEATAEIIVAVAVRSGQCAQLLNELAAGSAPTMDMSGPRPRLAFIPAELVRQLAEGR